MSLWWTSGTFIVLIGTAAIGAAGGAVGAPLMFRRRALMGDVLAHATLPGIAGAFIIFSVLHERGMVDGTVNASILMIGALVTGLCSSLFVRTLAHRTKLGDDVAMAVVLGVMFGLGIAFMGIAQRLPGAGPAGLSTWIYGRAASMRAADVWIVLPVSFAAIMMVGLLRRDLIASSFDQIFAATVGRPLRRVDVLLMLTMAAAAVAALPVIGLVLLVAVFVIPPATARLWTDRAGILIVLSSLIGAFGAVIGTLLSASFRSLPTGPVIVLVLVIGYLLSLPVRRWLMSREIEGANRGSPVGRQWDAPLPEPHS